MKRDAKLVLDSKTIERLPLAKHRSLRDVVYFDAQVVGFGLRIRGDRRMWVYQYRHNGASRRLTIGNADSVAPEIARRIAKSEAGEIASGGDPAGKKAKERAARRSALRFAAAAADFLQDTEASRRPRSNVETRRYLVGSYWRALHRMELTAITRADVAQALRAIRTKHGDRVGHGARSALSGMFVWAMTQGLCDSNPTIGTAKLQPAPVRSRVLSDAELAAIWAACDDDSANSARSSGCACCLASSSARNWRLGVGRSGPRSRPVGAACRAGEEPSPAHPAAAGLARERSSRACRRSSVAINCSAPGRAGIYPMVRRQSPASTPSWVMRSASGGCMICVEAAVTWLSDAGVAPHVLSEYAGPFRSQARCDGRVQSARPICARSPQRCRCGRTTFAASSSGDSRKVIAFAVAGTP